MLSNVTSFRKYPNITTIIYYTTSLFPITYLVLHALVLDTYFLHVFLYCLYYF